MANTIYRNARFLLSAAELTQLPPDEGIEVAFAGRSNAGKSSALNTLTEFKRLARVSNTPGRTQMINLFDLGEARRLVDLPGYGYAKVSHTIREQWQATMARYLQSRECLRGLVMLMDIRHPLTPLDQQMLIWAADSQLAIHILLTKVDKLSRQAAQKTYQAVLKAAKNFHGDCSVQTFSSIDRTGLDLLWHQLDQWYEVT